MEKETPVVRETPPPKRTPIVTGHFHEGPNYSAWRARGTHDYLLLFTQSGAGRIGGPTAGDEIVTGAGDVLILRPRARHDYGTAKHAAVGASTAQAAEWTFLWTHFVPRPHWAVWLDGWPDVWNGVCRLSLGSPYRENVETALTEMHARAQSGLFRRDEFALNALEEALLWCDGASPSSHPDRRDARVARAMAFLTENLAHPVSLDQTAHAANVSPSRLVHLFRQHTGQTMGQFVENERMARAKQLLALTPRTVGAVALEAGYENPFYFSLRFKKCTGLSPSQWRARENKASG